MIKITPDVDLQPLHTLGLNARAQALAWLDDRTQLPALLRTAAEYEQVHVLAGGSNIVFHPHVDGLVVAIRTRGIQLVKEDAQAHYVEVEAGECWHDFRSEEHTSELQSRGHLVCRLLLEKKKTSALK